MKKKLQDMNEWLDIINHLLLIEDYTEEEMKRQLSKRDALMIRIGLMNHRISRKKRH